MRDEQVKYIFDDLSIFLKDTNAFSALKNKKVFISGASGYIGKWLLFSFAYLNNVRNYNIRVIATSRNIQDSDITKSLNINNNFVFENVDVRNPFSISRDVNYVIHLAGNPDRRIHASDPLGVISTNLDGTRNVLDAATRLDNLENILVFSSGLIHGQQYFKDNVAYYKPRDTLSFMSCYTDSKRLQENICHIFSRQFQLPISIVRPYSFIGPLQELDRPWAINNFMQSALSGTALRVLGNPNTQKSYMYPTDMLHAVLECLVKDNGDNEVPLELGSSHSVSLSEVAECIRNKARVPVNIEYFDIEGKSAKQDFISVAKPCKENIQFEDAIRKTLNWHLLG